MCAQHCKSLRDKQQKASRATGITCWLPAECWSLKKVMRAAPHKSVKSNFLKNIPLWEAIGLSPITPMTMYFQAIGLSPIPEITESERQQTKGVTVQCGCLQRKAAEEILAWSLFFFDNLKQLSLAARSTLFKKNFFQNNKMEALPAYKNACISPLKASPMHSIIALITPSMVRTWRLRFGPQCGNKGPGRLLSMNSSRYMYGKVWRARSKDSQDAAHFHKYMYGQVWRAGTDLQDVLSANGSYIQGKASKLMLGPCKNNWDPIRRADAAGKMFRKKKSVRDLRDPTQWFCSPRLAEACLTVSWPDEPSGPNNVNFLY